MPRGRPVAPVELSEEAEAELTRISRSRSLPSSLVQRAQIVLACAVGASNIAVAARLGVGAATVGRWRRRYRERGLEGLHDELRPGRPRTYDDERVATVINDALQTKPSARTHWSVRAMASHSGVSKSTVQRWFKLFGLQPHRHQYSSCRPTRSSSRRYATSSGSTSTPRTTRWCCASTKRARFRRCSGRSRCCRWGWATSRG